MLCHLHVHCGNTLEQQNIEECSTLLSSYSRRGAARHSLASRAVGPDRRLSAPGDAR